MIQAFFHLRSLRGSGPYAWVAFQALQGDARQVLARVSTVKHYPRAQLSGCG
jgi:hypothetical protein